MINDIRKTQKKFLQVIDDENPFSETDSGDLLSLDDRHILADPAVYKTVKTSKEIGTSRFDKSFRKDLKVLFQS